jgi:hypothetical protein
MICSVYRCRSDCDGGVQLKGVSGLCTVYIFVKRREG